MPTSVHTMLILPNGTTKIYCKDGLSALTVLHVQEILNFHGQLKFVNCGAGNEWVALVQAINDMNAKSKTVSFDS